MNVLPNKAGRSVRRRRKVCTSIDTEIRAKQRTLKVRVPQALTLSQLARGEQRRLSCERLQRESTVKFLQEVFRLRFHSAAVKIQAAVRGFLARQHIVTASVTQVEIAFHRKALGTVIQELWKNAEKVFWNGGFAAALVEIK